MRAAALLVCLAAAACSGPVGPQGPEGPAGPSGDPGASGTNGATGSPGLPGSAGANGTDGTNATAPDGGPGPVGPTEYACDHQSSSTANGLTTVIHYAELPSLTVTQRVKAHLINASAASVPAGYEWQQTIPLVGTTDDAVTCGYTYTSAAGTSSSVFYDKVEVY